jgi:hypothetical protein
MTTKHMAAVKSHLEHLEALRVEQSGVGKQMLEAHNRALYMFDLLAIAALNRSAGLCSGFRQLIRSRNFICAAPLIRLQIDNALRLYAGSIVRDPRGYALSVLKGESVRRLKDRHGNLMRDDYLVRGVSDEFPWVPNVYANTSAYVHLSEKHMFNATQPIDPAEGRVRLKVSATDFDLPAAIYVEACEAMCAATAMVTRYARAWVFSKANPRIAAKLQRIIDDSASRPDA